MNAAFLIMSSAALAGADPIPPQYAPPIVYSGGAGCSTCGAPAPVADCCGKAHKVGLLDKLKARFSGFGKKSHGCGCTAEPACAPAPVCAPAPACNTCSTGGAAPAEPVRQVEVAVLREEVARPELRHLRCRPPERLQREWVRNRTAARRNAGSAVHRSGPAEGDAEAEGQAESLTARRRTEQVATILSLSRRRVRPGTPGGECFFTSFAKRPSTRGSPH